MTQYFLKPVLLIFVTVLASEGMFWFLRVLEKMEEKDGKVDKSLLITKKITDKKITVLIAAVFFMSFYTVLIYLLSDILFSQMILFSVCAGILSIAAVQDYFAKSVYDVYSYLCAPLVIIGIILGSPSRFQIYSLLIYAALQILVFRFFYGGADVLIAIVYGSLYAFFGLDVTSMLLGLLLSCILFILFCHRKGQKKAFLPALSFGMMSALALILRFGEGYLFW
jgi:hypothetical protein